VCYRALPAEIRELADRNYVILKSNPNQPGVVIAELRLDV
jgi:hypothetical protein